MRFKKTHLAACAYLYCLSNVLTANQAFADHLSLEDIDVTATRTEQKKFDHATIAGDSAKLLTRQPGISLYRAGGVSSLPVIRGLADDRIRIKVDGMDLISSCANHMNPPLSYIDPANVSELQVYSGISPVSLGGDSIAGTIVASSEKPIFSNSVDEWLTKASLTSFYRSNNNARGVNVNASTANANFYIRYTGATVKANNYHAGGNFKPAGLASPTEPNKGYLAGDEVGSSYYESINQSVALGLHKDNHLLELKLGFQDIPNQGFPNQRMDMTDNQANQYNLSYEGQYDWGKLNARAYHERVRHKMNFGEDKRFFYGDAPGMPMQTLGKTTGFKISGDIDLTDHHILRIGTETQRYRLDDYWRASGTGMMMSPNTFLNINNGQRDRFDVYAEWDANWNEQLFTQMGIRHGRVKMNADAVQGYNAMLYGAAANAFNASDRSQTDNNVDMTLLARYTPQQNQTYEVGYAIKNRSPNVYERFAWANSNTMVMNMNNWFGDGNGYVGNVNLKPETAHTLSVSGQWSSQDQQSWHIELNSYVTYVDNYIDAVACATVNKTCPNRNDGFSNLSLDNQAALLYGFDLSADKALMHGHGWGMIKATSIMSFVRGRNTQTDDDLYNIMPLNATFGLEQQIGQWSNRLELRAVAAKNRVEAIRNENQTSGFALLNLNTTYDWKHASVSLSVENILDKYYEDPLGGAYLGQGATMGTGIMQGVQVPGMGRSINVSATLYY